jgi:phosphoribosylglycinamide formyltransferase-1
MQMHRIAFLVSGNGGSLKVVAQAIEVLQLPWQICLVLADRDCGALHFAQQHQIACAQVAYTQSTAQALRTALLQSQPDLVVTTIHKIIDPETLALFPGRFINLHYSLLPAFKGYIGMETLRHAQQLNAGIVGATCHEVEEAVDSGKIVSQAGLAVDWNAEPMEHVENLVFRAAGLALLDGIHRKVGPTGRKAATLTYQHNVLLFAPPLSFEPAALDEEFWEAIKNS